MIQGLDLTVAHSMASLAVVAVSLFLLFGVAWFSLGSGGFTVSLGEKCVLGSAVGLPTDARAKLGWSCGVDVIQSLRAPLHLHMEEKIVGAGVITAEGYSQGLRVQALDWKLSSSQNFLAGDGFSIVIATNLKILPERASVVTQPCSTFVWLARGHSRRSCTPPAGATSGTDIAQANTMPCRTGCLIRLLILRAVCFFIEQPSSSTLWFLDCFQQLIADVRQAGRWKRKFLWMGHYGHTISKPIVLQGNMLGFVCISCGQVFIVWQEKERDVRVP